MMQISIHIMRDTNSHNVNLQQFERKINFFDLFYALMQIKISLGYKPDCYNIYEL